MKQNPEMFVTLSQTPLQPGLLVTTSEELD